jgi:anti-sigma regulatory factor (Ser/Thr protein kinase)
MTMPTSSRSLTATLPLSMRPGTPSRARAWVRATLCHWGLDDLVDTVELLSSELVGNAIRHTGRPRHLRLHRSDAPDATLTCEVADGDPRSPRRTHAVAADDESGRGMHLVALLTERNGTSRTPNGKAVWFQLAAPVPSY